MKNILALIEEKQRIYAQSPLFKFMGDSEIHPIKRLAFAPCAAPFIMSFADLCKYSLRQEPTNDKIQALLNRHTYEDDFHWQWFLEDLHQLGFNHLLSFNNSLEFLWSQETKNSRFLSNELYRNITQSDTLGKWIILEAMEAAADVFLTHTRKITKEIQLITNQEFKYFGNCHLNAESDHTAHSEDVGKLIADIQIAEENQAQYTNLVDTIFELFSQWNLSLLAYAQDYQISQLLRQQVYEVKEFKMA
jgi:hypothetical protein